MMILFVVAVRAVVLLSSLESCSGARVANRFPHLKPVGDYNLLASTERGGEALGDVTSITATASTI